MVKVKKEALMIPRYNERLPLRCPVVFAGTAYIGEGHVLNLTTPGCLIDSPCTVPQGDYVQLKMVLPGLPAALYVEVAAVRWREGTQFGVEFIQMSQADQGRLKLFLTHHLPAILAQAPGRRRINGRAGWRRDLENWSLNP
jgi:hypothetical protein